MQHDGGNADIRLRGQPFLDKIIERVAGDAGRAVHVGMHDDIDETLAAKYPYKRAYLPVNRLQHDGTLTNW